MSSHDASFSSQGQHGNCPLMHERKVRLVSASTWQMLANIYLQATAHRYEPKEDEKIGNCVQCYADQTAASMFPSRIEQWKENEGNQDLMDMLERGERRYPSALEESLVQKYSPENERELVILHHLDVQRWREAHSIICTSLNSKRKAGLLRKQLIPQLSRLLFDSSSTGNLGLRWKFRSLQSRDGELLGNCTFLGLEPYSQEEDTKGWLKSVTKSNVELLFKEEFKKMKETLEDLYEIIHSGRQKLSFEVETPSVSLAIQKGIGPKFLIPEMSGEDTDLPIFSDECLRDGVVVAKADNCKNDSNSTEKKPPNGPICKVIVHEIEDEGDFDVGVAATQINLEIESLGSNMATSSAGRPRRTRSAMTGKGPGGFPVREFEVALDGNLAHLRLLIHEANARPVFNQLLFLLPASAVLEVVELDKNVDNSKTLYEIVTGETYTSETCGVDANANHVLHMILAHRSSDPDATRKSQRRKKLTDEETSMEQSMMLFLIETSSAGWKDSTHAKKKSKPAQQERGFEVRANLF